MSRELETTRSSHSSHPQRATCRNTLRPLAVFDCCPTPPLKWPRLAAAVLVECARQGIPAAVVPVPLCGATSQVMLQGALVQIAAEDLSGIVINKCAEPGAGMMSLCAQPTDALSRCRDRVATFLAAPAVEPLPPEIDRELTRITDFELNVCR